MVHLNRLIKLHIFIVIIVYNICCNRSSAEYTEYEYFVNKIATYSRDCGNRTQPCPTLFDMFLTINFTTQEKQIVTINVDGQNITDIISRKQENIYNPCLPPPMNMTHDIFVTKRIIIIFSNNTRNLNDWFPLHLCDGIYRNEYMFDIATPIEIHNLIINNYSTSTMGFIHSSISYWHPVECIDCKFINITSKFNKALFYLYRAKFINTQFTNIKTTWSIHHIVGEFGDISIEHTSFININVVQSLITISDSVEHLDLDIEDVIFYNISTLYIIFDESRRTHYFARIWDTTIHMLKGSIYYSNHVYPSSIHIHNVSVSTQAFHEGSNSLFFTTSSDETTFHMLYILYLYDVNHLCSKGQDNQEIIEPSWQINELCLRILCQNPTTLIVNEGQLYIYNIIIDIEFENEMNEDHESCVQYSYILDHGAAAFIRNKKHMEISYALVTHSISHIFLYNEDDLMIWNLSIISPEVIDSNSLNSLQSEIILSQMNKLSSIFVNDSYFYGAHTHILATAGTLAIYESVFERGLVALNIENVRHLLLSHCIMINNGELYGRLSSSYLRPPIYISKCDDVFIMKNYFSGFNYDGSVKIATIYDKLVLEGNSFSYTINETEIFYNVSFIYIYKSWALDPSLTIIRVENAVLIDNVFLEFVSSAYVGKSWVEFSEASVCLSGNIFSNFAFIAAWSNITSCFRPNIIDCVNGNKNECIHSLYGAVNESLFDRMNTFVVLESTVSNTNEMIRIIYAHESIVSLDNVHITNNGSNTAVIIIANFHLLLIDSYVEPGVLLVSYEKCNTTYYDRMKSNVNYISRLSMSCNASLYNLYEETQNITANLVDYLSVMKINLTVKSSLYYPGDLLKFEYHATDKLDNIVTLDDINTTINLQTDSFLSTLNVENNICINCDIGVLLTDVSLKDIGTKYRMKVVVQDSFIATYPVLSVTIAGCPVGYSPDPNNFQCQQCNNDYYNMESNNTDECASCHLFDSDGVECSSGTINVSYNHWMGFDANSNMISAKCPPNYCCKERNGCDYIHHDTNVLCAKNRDYTSILCGKCNKGFSESMTSKHCIKCTSTIQFQYLLLPFCLSIISVMLLLRVDSNRNNKEIRHKKRDLRLMIKTMIFKCMFYYEQAISETVTTTSFVPLLSIFTSIFNLSVITDTDVIGDICFINGLNAKQKILMDLFVPIMLLVIVLILYIVSQYALKTPLTIRGRNVHFAKTFLTMYILMIGKILDVLFKLLSCIDIGTMRVHFYFGEEQCYGITWFSSLFALIFVIGGFAALFIKLKIMSISDRNNPQHFLYVFTSRYKRSFYWWEVVIFLRRIIVALFAAMIQDMTLRLMFVVIIAFCTFLQHNYNPFMIQEANDMEFILLCCLNIIILSQFPYAVELNETVVSIAISILIILPMPLVIYYIVIFIIRTRKISSKEEVKEESHNDVEFDVYNDYPTYSKPSQASYIN